MLLQRWGNDIAVEVLSRLACPRSRQVVPKLDLAIDDPREDIHIAACVGPVLPRVGLRETLLEALRFLPEVEPHLERLQVFLSARRPWHGPLLVVHDEVDVLPEARWVFAPLVANAFAFNLVDLVAGWFHPRSSGADIEPSNFHVLGNSGWVTLRHPSCAHDVLPMHYGVVVCFLDESQAGPIQGMQIGGAQDLLCPACLHPSTFETRALDRAPDCCNLRPGRATALGLALAGLEQPDLDHACRYARRLPLLDVIQLVRGEVLPHLRCRPQRLLTNTKAIT